MCASRNIRGAPGACFRFPHVASFRNQTASNGSKIGAKFRTLARVQFTRGVGEMSTYDPTSNIAYFCRGVAARTVPGLFYG